MIPIKNQDSKYENCKKRVFDASSSTGHWPIPVCLYTSSERIFLTNNLYDTAVRKKQVIFIQILVSYKIIVI